jgi:polar amino acid transport system substrate-binding protein
MMKRPIMFLTMLIISSFASTAYATSFTLLTEQLPPYSIKGHVRGNGSGTGVSIDIVSKLFTRAGFKYNIKIVPWKRAMRMSLNDENSCLFPMQRTQAREATYHWISPLLITQTGFYTRKDSPHQLVTIDDAKGLLIGSYNGSAVAEYLTSWGYQVNIRPNDAPNIHMLMKQRIDVWAADTLSAKYLKNKYKITNMKEQLVYFSTLRALACNIKVPNVKVSKLRQELKLMYTDGTMEKIIAKYK